MKELLSSIFSTTIRWLISACIALGSAYFAVEAWVDTKVEAAEKRVMFIRGLDMKHLDQRFDTLEKLISEKR